MFHLWFAHRANLVLLLLVCSLGVSVALSPSPNLNDSMTSSSGRTKASVSLSSLTVEGQSAPLGLDVQPRFSWIISSSQNGDIQTSYRLKVSKVKAGASDIWDSGAVSSKRSYLIDYGGPALSPDTRYFWTVDVVTKFGSSMSSSEFTTGLFSERHWGDSAWIGNPTSNSSTPSLAFDDSLWIWSTESDPPNSAPGQRAFRRTITAPKGKTLQSAFIVMTVDDAFILYVDGQLVGKSPNETDSWKYPQQYKVPLRGSSSVLAVLATNLADVTTGGDSPAALIAAVRVTFSDGSTQTIVSDTTWKVSNTVPQGFEQPSFDDASWQAAHSQGAFGVSPWNQDAVVTNPLGEHPAPLLRKELRISETISSARLYYAAGGYAHITINGAPASDRVLTPGFTKYDTTMLYVALDVKSLLRSGDNVIAAELGRSHYGSTQGSTWNWNTASWHGEPRVRMVLSLAFSDGTTQHIVTDGSWKTKAGPTRLDDLFGGENYDASFLQSGYDTAVFDASSWVDATVLPAPGGTLVNQAQPPTLIKETLSPVSITQPIPGIFVATFERVITGWVRLTSSGRAKSMITIHYGEKLHDDGTVFYEDFQHYYQNNFQTDRFWLAGVGHPETFEPKFSYKGFLHIQIEGWPSSTPPTAQDILARVVHDDLASHGDIETDNDLLNTMHKASVNTLLNNVHSIPTDCPTFEKNGWTGDAMLSTEMTLFNFDSAGLLTKYVRDLDETRLDSPGGNGAPSVIAPDSGWGAVNFQPAPTWNSAFIFIPWWIYYYRGDIRVLQDHYDSMKGYIEFEYGRASNNIASTVLGDWVSPETSPLGGNAPEDTRISATAYLYQMLVTMKQVATAVSKPSDADTFATQASNVKAAFNNVFLNKTTGYYTGVGDSGYRQTHNILALGFDLAPEESIKTVADSIAADVAAKGTHLNTGCLGTKYILPMLSEHGHVDTAFGVSTQTTFPSWGFWIENGATTMWEHWAVDARSHDHHFLGTFEDWLYKHVAGIQPTSPAYETVSISPLFTAQIPSGSAWTMTPFGKLGVQWNTSKETISVTLKIPVGVNATFSIPGGTGSPKAFGSGTYTFNI